MTKNDARKIVTMLTAQYSQHFRTITPIQLDALVDSWARNTEPYTVNQVGAALDAFIRMDVKGFPPVVGQVLAIISDENNPHMNAMEAWSRVRKAIGNGIYNAEKEFAVLPYAIRKAIGSPENIREMSMMDSDAMSVEQSHFIRQYNAVVEREKEMALIPESVRELIAGCSRRMIGVDANDDHDAEGRDL